MDASKIAFTSDYRYERVSAKGSKAFSISAFGQTQYSVAHNLGYKPYFRAWYTYDNSKYFQMFSGTASYALGGNGGQVDDISVDNTYFYFTISENNGSAISGTVYYRIYAEPQT